MPPTGKRIAMTNIEILRRADGKIIEAWGEADFLGLMQQLGTAAPPPLG
jgi:predicted ester cyclase